MYKERSKLHSIFGDRCRPRPIIPVSDVSKALLLGLITDDLGNRMGPSFTTKGSRKYRYYVSTPLVQAQGDKAGSVARVPADEVDTLVVSAMRDKLPHAAELDDTELVRTFVARVEVQTRRLIIMLKNPGASETDDGPRPSINSSRARTPRRLAKATFKAKAGNPASCLCRERPKTHPFRNPRQSGLGDRKGATLAG